MEIVEEHIQTAKNYIESAKNLDQMDLANENVLNELLRRAETQLTMAKLYIKTNIE